jgi:alpha-beta hydrolase superfamily lysophospholipase
MPVEWIGRRVNPAARSFAMRQVQGALHLPDGARPSTVLVASHFTLDFMGHYLAGPLARRGYAFFGWNNRYVGSDPFFRPDQALADIGMAVDIARERFEHVALLGNSGGGSLMSAYQSQASGSSIVGPAMEEIYGDAEESLGSLTPADAYIALNAHESRPKVLTEWFDPSVTDERDPYSVDPSLDLWGAEAGAPPYPSEFVRRYREAQVARNRRITAWVRGQLAEVEAQGGGDRMFSLHRAWADPRFLDLTLDPSDRTPGCYLSADVRRANRSAHGLASSCSLRTWLSMWSLDCDVLNVARHLGNVTVPALVIQATADRGVYPSNAEALHEHLGASDKTLVWIRGGDHYLDGAHLEQAVDAIDGWLRHRGLQP